jgi:hypothetical protein
VSYRASPAGVTPTEAALTLASDDALGVPRRSRNSALLAVHERLLAAKLTKEHWLWEQLEDAYATI